MLSRYLFIILLVWSLIAHTLMQVSADMLSSPVALMARPVAKPLRKTKNGQSVDEDINPRDMPPGTKVWIYSRYSTKDKQDPESQNAAVRKFVGEKGWVVDKTFEDPGVSGGSDEGRVGFGNMIYLATKKPRLAEIIVVWDSSRFARNQLHAQYYRALLRKEGWKILSIEDEIPSGPYGEIFQVIIDCKNAEFLNSIRASTRRGLYYIATQGCLPVGRVCKGFQIVDKPIGVRNGQPRMGHKPEVHPKESQLVALAFELKAQGATYAHIAEQTGLFPAGSGSWDHFFRNRVYIGEFEFQGEVFKEIYPPIISRPLFDAVQALLPQRRVVPLAGKNHPRRKGSKFFLANVSFCQHCHSPMEGKSVTGYRYYVCSQHNTNSTLCPQSKPVPADAAEDQLLEILIKQVLCPDYLKALGEWTNEKLNKGLEELSLRLEKTQNDYLEAQRISTKMAKNVLIMDNPTRTIIEIQRKQEERVQQLELELLVLKTEIINNHIEVSESVINGFVTRTNALIDRAELYDLQEICEQLCSRILMDANECTVEVHFPKMA